MATSLYRLFAAHRQVTTDSRNVPGGSLFFALRGPSFDGNSYASQALAKGAAYAVVDDPSVAVSERYVVVDDTLAALQALAAQHRRELGMPVIAITGSNGKTTTKELMAAVLSRKFRVSVTRGNLNNHIGVPLTLLSMDERTEMGIVEMGANNPGEIAHLCEIAQPDYGLITNVGLAHLEGFGSPGGVEKAKGELFDYLESHRGKAFFRSDDPALARMAAQRPTMETITYASHDADGFQSQLVGEYNRYNIAAAIAVGHYFSVARADIWQSVAEYQPGNMRSQLVRTADNTVILDCYNANPSSMQVAIENFAAATSDAPKVVILGDMGELGGYSEQAHAQVLELLETAAITQQYLVGSCMAKAALGRKPHPERHIFGNREELMEYLGENPLRGRFVLVKGSHAVGLEKVAEVL